MDNSRVHYRGRRNRHLVDIPGSLDADYGSRCDSSRSTRHAC